SPAAVSPACAGRRRGLRRSLARAAVPYGDCGGAEPLNLAEIFKFLYGKLLDCLFLHILQ
ncbi:MAG: hypothetical protein V1770_03790, partial [bacterium]